MGITFRAVKLFGERNTENTGAVIGATVTTRIVVATGAVVATEAVETTGAAVATRMETETGPDIENRAVSVKGGAGKVGDVA